MPANFRSSRPAALFSLAILAAVAMLPRSAGAAVVRPQSTAALTRLATHVVRGRVLAREAAIDPALHRPVLRTRLAIDESLKGEPRAEIVIQQLGGKRGGRVAGVPGDAGFTVGEEVLVFLRAGSGANAGVHFLLGFAQGKYEIHRTRDGQVTAERSFRDVTFLPRAGEKVPTRAPVPLDDLRREIRAVTAGGAK